jgi:tRNA-2-methylthio-N6-dimethylallyladenosine synthase
MAKTYHIVTFGCQMNEHDSERIAGILAERGYVTASEPESADLILINTCSVREKADQKAFSYLGRLQELKIKNPHLKIALCGCTAQLMGKKVFERAPYVDLVFGTQNVDRLGILLDEMSQQEKRLVEIVHDRKESSSTGQRVRTHRNKAWVTIMEGCDNFCSYCVVPYARGRERSRGMEEVILEVAELARAGVYEVTLLGQNVNSYGGANGKNFPYLLSRINAVSGLKRIRFVTSHPKDFSPGLISAVRDLDKVCEHIHLPVQSGSDNILVAMNRGYKAGDYLEKVDSLRQAIPDVSLTTDIIVGFPGETESDFQATLDLVKRVKFDAMFSFIYSPRPGIKALELETPVPGKVALERFERLLGLQDAVRAEKAAKEVGKIYEVLVEGVSKSDPSRLSGRTRTNKLAHFIGSDKLIGQFVTVRITETLAHSMLGELTDN